MPFSAPNGTTGRGDPICLVRRLIVIIGDRAIGPKFRILRAGGFHDAARTRTVFAATPTCLLSVRRCDRRRSARLRQRAWGPRRARHGDLLALSWRLDNAAPPLSVNGKRDASDAAVGAHQAHLRGTALRAPLACSDCHVVPEGKGTASHIDGRAIVTFGALPDRRRVADVDARHGQLQRDLLPWRHGVRASPRPSGTARRRGRLRRLPRPPRRRRTCRTRTAAVATSATPRVGGRDHARGRQDRREAARVQRLPRLGHDRRPAHRHRRRDRHDGPRGRRARAAPARRHHPRPTLLQRVPRPPVRDAPRRRQGRPRLGRLASAEGAAPSFDRATATCSSTLAMVRRSPRRRDGHRPRLDSRRRGPGVLRHVPRGAPGVPAPVADGLQPLQPAPRPPTTPASTSRVASTSTAPSTSCRSPARCATAPRA